MSCKVVTYNTSTDGDFLSRAAYRDAKEPNEQLLAQRKELGQQAIKELLQLNAQLFCLQESHGVFDAWVQPLVKNFEHEQSRNGTCVMWDRERFERTEQKMINSHIGIAVVLKDRISNLNICLASLHVPGFSLEALKNGEHQGLTKQDVLADIHLNILPAIEQFCKELLALGRWDWCVIGSDTNSDPSIFPGIHSYIHSLGFRPLVSDHPTQHLWTVASLQQRNLDAFFFRAAGAKILPTPQVTTFQLNHAQNPTDHIPLIAEVEPQSDPKQCGCTIS